MKLYLAGIFTSNFHTGGRIYNALTEEEKIMHDAIPHILESYHYVKRASFVNKMRNSKHLIFLDSGAYSAFTKGVETDITAYCDYIKENADIVVNDGGALCASVLDSIGDYKQTFRNQEEMQRQGVVPLPCFHYGEPPEVLEYYVKNYKYITLGGMVPISTPQLRLWLDWIWEKYLTDANGYPRLKVHGFGLTTYSLMRRYPWYSVDSSLWVQNARVGNILFLRNHKIYVMSVSDRSPSLKMEGKHIETMLPEETEWFFSEMERTGFTYEKLSQNYVTRWLFNCHFCVTLGQYLTKTVLQFKAEQGGLF